MVSAVLVKMLGGFLRGLNWRRRGGMSVRTAELQLLAITFPFEFTVEATSPKFVKCVRSKVCSV